MGGLFLIEMILRDFPCGAVDGNQPACECTYAAERAPQLLKPRCWTHRPQLLSLYVATTEALAPRACALQWEKPQQRSLHTTTKCNPHSLQLDKACEWQQKTQHRSCVYKYILSYCSTQKSRWEEAQTLVFTHKKLRKVGVYYTLFYVWSVTWVLSECWVQPEALPVLQKEVRTRRNDWPSEVN